MNNLSWNQQQSSKRA